MQFMSGSRLSTWSRLVVACALLVLVTGLAAAEPPRRGHAGSEVTATAWQAVSEQVFSHLSQDEGLPHPFAESLAQDAAGQIWIGTQAGISRFDGSRVHSYVAGTPGSGGLPVGVVRALHVDARGRLWIGLDGKGGLARFDPQTDSFVRYPVGAEGLSAGGVFALSSDSEGLWIATPGGLDRLDFEADRITRARPAKADATTLRMLGERVRWVCHGRDGSLWVAGELGLVRWPGAAAELRRKGAAPMPAEAVAGLGFVSVVVEDSAGRIWFGSQANGVGWLSADGAVHPVLPPDHPKLRGKGVSRLVEAAPGLMLAGIQGEGLLAISDEGGSVAALRHDASLGTSLAANTVFALLRDRSGQVWIGTIKGVDRARFGPTPFVNVQASLLKPGGISDDGVFSFGAGSDGSVYLGYYGQGLGLLRPGAMGGAQRLLIRSTDGAPDLDQQVVRAIVERRPGRLWVASNAGVYEVDLGSRSARRVPLPTADPFPRVYALQPAPGGWWVGSGEGLVWLADAGGHQVFKRVPGQADSLPDARINNLYLDTKGRLWVGMRTGVALMTEWGRFRSFQHRPGRLDSLCNDIVYAMRGDSQGRLWVATAGCGVSRIDPSVPGGHIDRVDRRAGLPNENTAAVLLDPRGRVWVSTIDGLALVDPATLQAQSFGRGDGIATRSYWAGSALALNSGELLFGGPGGLTLIEPERLQTTKQAPPIVISALTVEGKAMPSQGFNQASPAASLVLAAPARGFEIEYAALEYANPSRIRYQHRLEGFEDRWINAPAAHHSATYTNLPPGDYRLLIRATNSRGVWNEQALAIPVQVLPTWQQTWWFRSLAVLAVMLVLGVASHLRTAVLRRSQQRLEREVAVRTAALERLAMLDALTGVANRRHFEQRAALDFDAARERDQPLSLIAFDIDHFKSINDRYGHAGGDEVLKAVASRCQQALRAEDLLARIGGEEFVALLRETTLDEARGLAERLRQALATAPVPSQGQAVTVTSSFGVAQLQEGEGGIEALLARADAALYRAKNGGRNRVEI